MNDYHRFYHTKNIWTPIGPWQYTLYNPNGEILGIHTSRQPENQIDFPNFTGTVAGLTIKQPNGVLITHHIDHRKAAPGDTLRLILDNEPTD